MRLSSLFVFVVFICLSLSSSARDITFGSAIVDAADAGDKDEVIRMLKKGTNPDSRGSFNVTPLMRASFRGYTDIAEILIKSGAYINAADIGGATALHLAARNGNYDMVDLLIKNGALVDVPDKEQWTPLMRASLGKHTRVVQLLVDNGADITKTNEFGESVLIHAAVAGVPEIMSIITGNKKFKDIPESQSNLALEVAEKRGKDSVKTILSSSLNKPAAQTQISENNTQEKEPAFEFTPPKKPLEPEQVATTEPEKQIEKPVPPIQISKQPVIDDSKEFAKAPDKDIFDKKKEYKQLGSIENKDKPIEQASFSSGAVAGNFFYMQLGAFASDDQALFVWQNLKERNSDVLSKLDAHVVRTFIAQNQNVVYRLRAGYFNQKELAEQSCKSLRARNIECFVVETSSIPYEVAKNSAGVPIDEDAELNKEATEFAGLEEYKNNKYPPVKEIPDSIPPPQKKAEESTAPSEDKPYSELVIPPVNEKEILPWKQLAAAPVAPVKETAPAEMRDQFLSMLDDKSTPPAQPTKQDNTGIADTPKNNTPISSPAPAKQPVATKTPEQIEAEKKSLIEKLRKESMQEISENKKLIRKAPAENPDIKGNYGAISEAVLVPDDSYIAPAKQVMASGNGIISIVGFASKEAAQDYDLRMFKYNEDLRNLDVRTYEDGDKAKLTVSGLNKSQEEIICNMVKPAGYSCAENTENQNSPRPNSIPEGSFIINLGVFADKPEAEYYWMFLQEDNGDILSNLIMDTRPAPQNATFGPEAVQLITGPFDNRPRAEQICGIMRYRKIDCLVTQ